MSSPNFPQGCYLGFWRMYDWAPMAQQMLLKWPFLTNDVKIQLPLWYQSSGLHLEYLPSLISPALLRKMILSKIKIIMIDWQQQTFWQQIIPTRNPRYFIFQRALMEKPMATVTIVHHTSSCTKVAVWISSKTEAPRYKFVLLAHGCTF